MLSLVASFVISTRLGPWFRTFDAFGALGATEQRENLALRIRGAIEAIPPAAVKLAEWKRVAKTKTVDDLWKAWADCPVLTKKDLQSTFAPERLFIGSPRRVKIDMTGGSTGEPTRFLVSPAMSTARTAAAWYSRRQMGWYPGLRLVAVWGSDRDIGKHETLTSKIKDAILNRRVVGGFVVGSNLIDSVRKASAGTTRIALYGYSSLLEELSRQELARPGALPKVQAAWIGGEGVSVEQKKLFREAFNTDLLNFYGGRELSAIAFQEPGRAQLRILRPYVYVEVLDDLGRACVPGQTGRIICTSLVGGGTPFLRYEIGDLGSYSSEALSESGLSHLANISGRMSGILRLPDGRKLSNIFWNHLFKEFSAIRGFQIRQKSSSHLLLIIVTDSATEELRRDILKKVTAVLGPSIQLSFEFSVTLPRTPQGKLCQIVQDVQELL